VRFKSLTPTRRHADHNALMAATPSRQLAAPRATLTATLVAVLASLALAGCAGSEQASSGQSSSTLNVNVAVPPTTLDPSNGLTPNDEIGANFYVRLFDYKNGKIVPWLAKSYTVSRGGTVYSMKLRPGLTFADGTPVNAAAVKFTFDRGLKGPVASYDLSNGLPGNVASVEAPSAYTVVIRLKQPDSSVLSAWAAPTAGIIDPKVGLKNPNALRSREAGSGPFELVSYTPNTQIVMKPRPSYERWSGQTDPTRRVVINFVGSDTTLLLDARTGNADVTWGMSKRSAASLKSNPNVTLYSANAGSVLELLLMWYRPPFDNPDVRAAVSFALPYRQILATGAAGYGHLFNGPVLPGMQFYNAQLSSPRATDLARARQLMAESGVKTPVNVQLSTLASDPEQQQIATILQSALAPIGIKISIAQLTPTAFNAAQYGFKMQAALQNDGPFAFNADFILGYDVKCSEPDLGPNLVKMCIPGMDHLLQEARTTTGTAQRQALYNQITTLWQKNTGWVNLYGEDTVTVLKKGVTGFEPHLGFLDLRNVHVG
jgi:peptide/nickel transport system substrate-binding protein